MNNATGRRREGYCRSIGCIPRHGGASKQSASAQEKAEKTKVRRAGKREIRDGLTER